MTEYEAQRIKAMTTNSREIHFILLWRTSRTIGIKCVPNFDVLSHDLIQFYHNGSKSWKRMKFIQAFRFQYYISNFFSFCVFEHKGRNEEGRKNKLILIHNRKSPPLCWIFAFSRLLLRRRKKETVHKWRL